MEEKHYMDSAVAQRDRISVEVSDIRKLIEECRTDPAWAELALAAKIRVLVKERLEQIKQEQAQKEAPSPDKGKGDKSKPPRS